MDKIKTAYMEDAAFEYDKIRFLSPQGRLFNSFEEHELECSLQALERSAYVVEVGCGTGRFLPLAARYSDHVTGIDPSKDMLQMTQEKVANILAIQLLEGEGASVPLKDGSQDLVYSIRTLNQVGTHEYAYRMIKELFRICKPGGQVLLEIVNRKSLNRAKADVRFTVDEICHFLTAEKLGSIERKSGILFFSQTILDKTPAVLIPAYRIADQAFSRLFPKRCTRCYILARKPS